METLRINVQILVLYNEIRMLILRVPIYFLESVDFMYQCTELSFGCKDSVCPEEASNPWCLESLRTRGAANHDLVSPPRQWFHVIRVVV